MEKFSIIGIFEKSKFLKMFIKIIEYIYNHMLVSGDFYMPWIKVNKEVKELLELKSERTSLSEDDLANGILFNALKDEKRERKKGFTPEEIYELLEHDLPEGDWVSEKLAGLADFDYVTDAVELKKNSYKRGRLP